MKAKVRAAVGVSGAETVLLKVVSPSFLLRFSSCWCPVRAMPSLALCLEALSALSGCQVEAASEPSPHTPQDFVNIVALREFFKQEGLKQLEYPSLGTLTLQDPGPMLCQGPGPQEGQRIVVKINPEKFFHPAFNYDFTNVQDRNRTFLRGNERYVRPCGWNRVALWVTNVYEDGDAWLGTDAQAWPVSYHGHKMDGSLGIILAHKGEPGQEPVWFLEAAAAAAAGNTKGRGVYSTPDIRLAETYCQTFTSKEDGKTYKVVLQNRINPRKRVQCQREGVWLVYVPEDSTHLQTINIVQNALRPYGLLLKQV
ncbi:uncharacterized protein LOC103393795 isoform X3 [Cynoglossus semilaevis]|uniref:uncharacterized protein LOC103393795 isoform X3 n=1 Tax=Cynoglossus semilaevis TaxID=244447 RepID=UPI000D6295A4|nr:uncharacterized protein LOC103393795 isoform X3 [Cynoglossus semilaevis]